MRWDQIEDMEIDGISMDDYPDMSDATVIYATWKHNGQKLTNDELDQLNNLFAEQIQEEARNRAL